MENKGYYMIPWSHARPWLLFIVNNQLIDNFKHWIWRRLIDNNKLKIKIVKLNCFVKSWRWLSTYHTTITKHNLDIHYYYKAKFMYVLLLQKTKKANCLYLFVVKEDAYCCMLNQGQQLPHHYFWIFFQLLRTGKSPDLSGKKNMQKPSEKLCNVW